LAQISGPRVASVPANAATIQVTIDKLVFSPVEIEAKIGDRNIRNTLLAGAACLLSLALGGVLEPLFKKYPNHPGYSWSRTSRVANFATESNRSATPNSIHPQQLGLELFDITVRHKRRNPEEQYGRPFHAPR